MRFFGRRPRVPVRRLGRTGVDIPILGLGTAPLGHRPEQDAVPFLERCLDAGLTHLDTGPRKGGFGDAQPFLRPVIRERRDQLFIATRCTAADGDTAMRELRENLDTLGIERADLVYVQSIGDEAMAPERIYAPDGVCRALEKARADGLTRFLGVSGHNRPARFLRALEEWDFDVMLNAVNVVSRYIYGFEERVWPAARQRGIGLLGMKVFGGVKESRLSAKGAHLPDALKPAALRYGLGLPGVSGVVIGIYDDAELHQNLAWLAGVTPLSGAELGAREGQTRALASEWHEIYGPVA
jgi:aryl-alcohol dehydrogenase-like predicted oxidoreductase